MIDMQPNSPTAQQLPPPALIRPPRPQPTIQIEYNPTQGSIRC
ncbi:MAG: hypothetical protein ACK56F_29440 [bacterium]